ncbi:response regulator [Thiopseudomonas acetoxidans]|uniref:Response regulator transcription factor n=1 Tax=Thiopseudomonas acetoxidans TaxID=3041622 RepID=A0ABT7ST93_9GAMM|nr:response regulator transcription factor [Thiopseudomonas sp. CY1220]MDM7858749.1 response regulator transcription factor [Thiopseudomonas sp. CY1220]
MKILLVEDDQLLGDGIAAGLIQAGFTVDWVLDGQQADTALLTNSYDAVVLDLGLPKRSGMDVLKRARAQGKELPILILTAYSAVEHRVAGLDAGADDYLAKPFDLTELQARLRALLRRSKGYADAVIRQGELSLDPASHTVLFAGQPVDVSAREFKILHSLLLNAGRVMSKAQLEEQLYGWGDEIESNTIEVFVHHLRRKLNPQLILTVRGVGYMIEKTTP